MIALNNIQSQTLYNLFYFIHKIHIEFLGDNKGANKNLSLLKLKKIKLSRLIFTQTHGLVNGIRE